MVENLDHSSLPIWTLSGKRLGVSTGGAGGAGGGGRRRRRPVLQGEVDWMTPEEVVVVAPGLGATVGSRAGNGAREGGEMLRAGAAAFGGLGSVFRGLDLRPGT